MIKMKTKILIIIMMINKVISYDNDDDIKRLKSQSQ